MELTEFVKQIDPIKLRRFKKLSSELLFRIVENYKSGLTIPALARYNKLDKSTVSRALKLAGIQAQRKDGKFQKRVLSRKQRDTIVAGYVEGKSIEELEAIYHINHTTIAKILERRRLKYKIPEQFNRQTYFRETRLVADGKRKILSLDDRKLLCAEYINGLPQIKLAVKWGVSVSTVETILKKYRIISRKAIPSNVFRNICDDYIRGTTVYDLSKLYGVHPKVIKYWLFKSGVIQMANVNNVITLPANLGEMTAREMRKRMRSLSPEVIARLVEIINDPAADNKDIIAAAKLIFERAWGRVKETEEEHDDKNLDDKHKILQLVSPELKKDLFKNGTGEK
jgi:DNA invertase Pin-like site-specific DNA recombinase